MIQSVSDFGFPKLKRPPPGLDHFPLAEQVTGPAVLGRALLRLFAASRSRKLVSEARCGFFLLTGESDFALVVPCDLRLLGIAEPSLLFSFVLDLADSCGALFVCTFDNTMAACWLRLFRFVCLVAMQR